MKKYKFEVTSREGPGMQKNTVIRGLREMTYLSGEKRKNSIAIDSILKYSREGNSRIFPHIPFPAYIILIGYVHTNESRNYSINSNDLLNLAVIFLSGY